MHISLITAVWGPWHVEAFARATLPTLLAERNLPALAAMHECRYRLFTTGTSLPRIESIPSFRNLRALMPVEVMLLSQDDSISSDNHVAAWRSAAEEAAACQAAVVAVHPDTPWSNGSFEFLGKALTEGYKAIVVSNIRVVSETFIPALERHRTGGSDGPIAMTGREASALALRHFHPLSAAMVPQVGCSAAATEIYWAAAGQGLALRHSSRPAIAAVPHVCPLDVEFYMHGVTDSKLVLNVDSVDSMLMLSMTPLFKDFGLLELDRPLMPQVVGLWSAHPQNDTPLNHRYARDVLHLPMNPDAATGRWTSADKDSAAFMDRAVATSDGVKLMWALLRAKGCQTMAGLIAFAIQDGGLDERLHAESQSVVLLVPTDDAFAQNAVFRSEGLVAPGREAAAAAFFADHLRVGSADDIEKTLDTAGVAVVGRESAGRHTVLIVDRIMSEAGKLPPAPATSSGPNLLQRTAGRLRTLMRQLLTL